MPNEEPLSPQEESLPEANGIDPNGPPQPEKGPKWVRGAVTTVGCLTVGGVLFSMSGTTPLRTGGVMPASQLKWENRDGQGKEAPQKDQNAEEDDKSTSTSDQDE